MAPPHLYHKHVFDFLKLKNALAKKHYVCLLKDTDGQINASNHSLFYKIRANRANHSFFRNPCGNSPATPSSVRNTLAPERQGSKYKHCRFNATPRRPCSESATPKSLAML